MAIVYDVKTGEALKCEAVDVKELISSGAYTDKQKSDEPKRGRPAKPEKAEQDEK
jgi:hypothetical protein